ncbi:MarR family winged helix-turn-helix transcriptional regulator [Rhizobium sp. P28RR-XV]|uniref:MarR family winged helix-turn-helix transcriptional regulator n=1 Tax=Rhizobium sp. P28RR-XV TaxID=2726737 RepID=UPI0014567C60|nr:MarR family transcriptional regulator [Rhizobium sp. P28RR-XV]NLR88180.1 MarR family transcriptional regulator [Rhizobium sp. P28RR-XV]
MPFIHKLPGHLIRRLHQHSVAIFTQKMQSAGFDLTQLQFAVLSAIQENPGIDQATLATFVAMDKVTIGDVVSRLEARQLLWRLIKESDRRARTLTLTGDGNKLLDEIRPVVLEIQDEILRTLSAEERDCFIHLITTICDPDL